MFRVVTSFVLCMNACADTCNVSELASNATAGQEESLYRKQSSREHDGFNEMHCVLYSSYTKYIPTNAVTALHWFHCSRNENLTAAPAERTAVSGQCLQCLFTFHPSHVASHRHTPGHSWSRLHWWRWIVDHRISISRPTLFTTTHYWTF